MNHSPKLATLAACDTQNRADSKMLIIDAIGPFFRHYKSKRINWSKIPFAELESGSTLKPEVLETVPTDFQKFVSKAKEFGYTGVTLDDIAHLIPSDFYPKQLNEKIDAYRRLFSELFQSAKNQDLDLFITTDIMFSNSHIQTNVGNKVQELAKWLAQQIEKLFIDFPEIDGIVTRFGESDGVDVAGDFLSKLVIKKPNDAKILLQTLLPVFEKHQRKLIFRTWSVGAYPIGDLIWNEKTFNKVFGDIDSPSLIISMKYGESDFFRYLPTNKLFFASEHQKIVEFQARREYEGFGAYPSFVGWDCESHLTRLKEKAKNVIGVSVWCQTGGWGKRRQLTFVRSSSPWVELNSYVIPKLWSGETCSDVIENYQRKLFPNASPGSFEKFLRLSDEAIEDLLYIREFAERRIFFRRLRLPPQIYVFWDRVIVDHNMKRILSCLVRDRKAALEQGDAGLEKVRLMRKLAIENEFPTKGLKYQIATFELLQAAREYFFQPFSESTVAKLENLKSKYKAQFNRSYSVQLNFKPTRIQKFQFNWLFKLILRKKSKYRVVDQLFTLRILSWMYACAKKMDLKIGPGFANEQAMGIDALFK